MPSRDIAHLHPVLQPVAQQFLAACEAQGINALITCTYRSAEEQEATYAQGRTLPGPIVTWARGGESPHNATLEDGTPASQAFDVCPLDAHGKPIWDAGNPAWREMGEIGISLGLEWGGSWVKKPDFPHFQLPEG